MRRPLGHIHIHMQPDCTWVQWSKKLDLHEGSLLSWLWSVGIAIPYLICYLRHSIDCSRNGKYISGIDSASKI